MRGKRLKPNSLYKEKQTMPLSYKILSLCLLLRQYHQTNEKKYGLKKFILTTTCIPFLL